MIQKKISVVIPTYNEEKNITPIADKLTEILDKSSYLFELIFIDDGSNDNSSLVIRQLSEKNKNIFYIELSRNFGHQNALKAGFDYATGDCIISLDCDMQHPPELINLFLQKWEEGYDVVYGVRKEDPDLSWTKRKTSALFYKLISSISDLQLESGTADFRLVNKKVKDVLINMNEKDFFIRGIVKWVGFRQFPVEFFPGKRSFGESKYSFVKMFRFALQGITSFSTRPLYIATYLGISFSLLSVLFVPYALISYFTGHVVSGWTSLIATIVFFGGLQLMILGVIGIYIGKLVMQSKDRPSYIVNKTNLR